jgi:hypothetical protein
MMLIALSGAIAGAFHVLSGPDHLAAVAPLALASRARAWREGWRWGVGHTSGVLVVATLALALREVLPPADLISSWGERLVGAALIGIGVWSLVRALRIGPLAHSHGSLAHGHTHVQAGPKWARRLGHPHASFAMGVLHGAAGSSHVLGIVPALALPSTSASLLYLTMFGGGSIVAMAAFAACVGRVRPLNAGAFERTLMAACGALAIVVGAFWVWGAPS